MNGPIAWHSVSKVGVDILKCCSQRLAVKCPSTTTAQRSCWRCLSHTGGTQPHPCISLAAAAYIIISVCLSLRMEVKIANDNFTERTVMTCPSETKCCWIPLSMFVLFALFSLLADQPLVFVTAFLLLLFITAACRHIFCAYSAISELVSFQTNWWNAPNSNLFSANFLKIRLTFRWKG